MGASHAKASGRSLSLGTLALQFTERRQLLTILCIALLQGLLFVWLVPPWQHYDEPTHFEYAWLIAQLGRRPYPGDESATMRREVQASMAARGYFSIDSSLIEDDASLIKIGYSELGHPPGYYALAAIPIAVFRHLDVTSQLYLARLVSVCLFVLTVAIGWGVTRDLTAPGSPLRWSVPLILALLPSFADVMSSVNNDVGAVFASSLFIWGAVRLIMYGFNWQYAAWVVSTAVLCVSVKNTAMFALALTPAAFLFAAWMQWHWRLRWLWTGLLGLTVAALLALFGWGDAALWYRADTYKTQVGATRKASNDAQRGSYVFALHADTSAPAQTLLYPLRSDDVQRIAGRTITVGAWIWADREIQLVPLALDIRVENGNNFQRLGQPVALSNKPAMVAQSFELPNTVQRAQLVLNAAITGSQEAAINIYVDDVIMSEGSFDTTYVPLYNGDNDQYGTWGGRPFANLVANASAEQSWPRPRAWIDDYIRSLARHRPSEIVLSLVDIDRTGRLLATWAAPLAIDGLVERLAWGQVRLQHPVAIWLLRSVGILSLAGCVLWLRTRALRASPALRAALTFCALVIALIWCATILRPLPALGPAPNIPATRYAFPAMVPTVFMLLGGWLILARRPQAVAVLVGAVLLLNVASILTLRAFFGAQ